MKQKGFVILPLVIVVAVFLLGGYIFFKGSFPHKNNNVTPLIENKIPTPTPIIYEAPPTVNITPTPIELKPNRIYLLVEPNKIIYISLDTPNNIEVEHQSQIGFITSKVTIGNNTYSVSAKDAGRMGPCSIEDFEKDKCGYTDESIEVESPFSVEVIRIWKNENGIFLINPQSITSNYPQEEINNILISKLQPNNIFTAEEVDMWKQLLTNIKLQK